MRPIYLKMTAFGPYKGVEEINFNELKEHRLFVISGPTGAGKTTIFDAICFAIYGTSSGSDRENVRMLRSDFASDEVHTSVEFIFEINHRTYRVFRQLGHVKAGRKSSTGEKYELCEILADGMENPIVERAIVTEVNRKLEEIIGLTYDQFSQIVMLPQGEFRKLLTSQSENKEAILRKIFKTDRYGQMVKILDEKKQKAESDARHAKMLRDSYIEQISGALPQRESSLFTLLNGHANVYQIQGALTEELHYYQNSKEQVHVQYNEAQKTYHEANEKYIAAKAMNDQLDALEVAKENLKKLESEKPEYEELKLKAETAQRANSLVYLDEQCLAIKGNLTKKEQAFEQAKEQLQVALKEMEDAKSRYESELENEPKRKQLVETIHHLNSLKPVYDQISRVEEMLQKAQQLAMQKEKDFNARLTEIESLKGQYNALKVEISGIEKEVVNRPALIEQLHRVKTICQVFEKLTASQTELLKAKEAFEKEQAVYLDMKEKHHSLEKEWMSNQAYVLASQLRDNEPCPVCGSVEHPNKQLAHSDSVSQEMVEQSKEQLSKVEKQHNDKEVAYKLIDASVGQLKAQLVELNVAEAERESYLVELQNVTEQNIRLQQEEKRLSALKQKEQLTQERIENLESALKQLEYDKNQHEKDVIGYSSELKQMKSQMDSQIPFLHVLVEQISKKMQELEQSEKVWEEVKVRCQNCETALATANQTVKLYEQQVQEMQDQLNIAKEQFLTKMRQLKFETYGEYRNAILAEEEIQRLLDAHLTFSKNLHALEEKVKEDGERLKDQTKVDLTDALRALQQLKQQEEYYFEQYKLTEKLELQCQHFINKLSEVADEIHRLEDISNQIMDVYNLLRGQNTKKISFERYIQIGYLEQITEAANERLRVLSNGQFMLICSDRQESHGRQSGLSLDVYDSYTGQTRDVKTLSGGEKFNASLSLALGMADIIQSYQGSVRIDTMFIDEGFGSLDEESLMRAIDTLIELQNAGRMIGVISHVAELKNTIPAVLQVIKEKEGYSKTKFIVS